MADTPTYTDLVNTITTAIGDIAAGRIQSYSLNGKSYTFLNLQELEDLRTRYQRLADTQTNPAASLGFFAVNYISGREKRG